MTLYLKMDGTNYLKTPSITYDTVEMTITPIDISNGKYYLDARNALSGGYFNSQDGLGAGWTSEYVNDVLSSSRQKTFTLNQKVTIKVVSSTTTNGVITLFSASNYVNGYAMLIANIYDVKMYNAGSLVVHYDMSTGTIQDTSGNGNHGILYKAGTWLDDGTGGGTPDVTVTSVLANSSADSIAPAVTAQRQLSVSSVIADTTADAIAPTIQTESSVSTSIDTLIATLTADAISPTLSTDTNLLGAVGTSTADALIPSVGSFTNITVSAVITNASADGISSNVSADRSISLAAPFADSAADTFAPMVGLSASVQITAVVTSATSDGIAPSIATQQGTRIDTATAELTVDAISPTVQTEAEAIIRAFIADVLATGLAPIINKDAIPEYREVIQIVLNITRSQSAALGITQRMQSELKL